MNNFNGISQISDESYASQISHVKGSQILNEAQSLPNLLEEHCRSSNNASRNVTNQGSSLERTVKCLVSCEENIEEHIKVKLILDCIKEASDNAKGTLSDEVIAKLKGLLLNYEFNKYIHLPSKLVNVQEELPVLGITDLPRYDLTREEMLDAKCSVETLLREKIHNFILRYEQLGGNMKEVLRSTDCNMCKKIFEPHVLQVLQWKDKIKELCDQYEADIEKCSNLMNKWNKMKYKDTSQIYKEKAEYILLQSQVAEMQAKITKLSCIMKMYKETPITIDAYRTLNATMDEKLSTLMNEIKEKENLKKQYENLQNTEYDEVTKTYLELCKAIKKKKQILEKL